MNKEIIKYKEKYVQDTQKMRDDIAKTQDRINKEKSKLARQKRKFEKAQLEYKNDASTKLLEDVSKGFIAVEDLPNIQAYLFDDIGLLDVSSEYTTSSSHYDDNDEVDNPFADSYTHSKRL